MSQLFPQNPQSHQRRPTRTVWVGQVAIGGNNPIRVQSMTTSDTKDTQNLIPEIEGLVNVGCEIVRVTVPTPADCDNLPNIRAEMKKRGIKVPLVADIHFTPSVAMNVVPHVEKVRINPGNFVDKKKFKVWEYTDEQYNEELERIREKFTPLVLKCKEFDVAMRIGTNHGSLSDRIMNRYGDTPEGMVESALEFVRICGENDYHNLVLSMKASNVRVMIAAYRLLAERMKKEGMNYPFHLGVTEAGEGEEGRIKSAIGIGSLLEEGIGDTIRVSLTEDSIYEVPVAYALVKKYNAPLIRSRDGWRKATDYERRKTSKFPIGNHLHGGEEPVRVWVGVPGNSLVDFVSAYESYVKTADGKINALEGIEIDGEPLSKTDPKNLQQLSLSVGLKTTDPEVALRHYLSVNKITAVLEKGLPESFRAWLPVVKKVKEKEIAMDWCFAFPSHSPDFEASVLGLTSLCDREGFQNYLFSFDSNSVGDYRRLASILEKKGLPTPIHIRYQERAGEAPLLSSAILLGSLLCDGIGDSVQIDSTQSLYTKISSAYNILQGSRVRTSKTEYISCPSCGRTQFDLQTTTERIRKQTSHLKGVKIAVMGCVVNGPGEMADADFGYVGTGPKKVSLYVGKECVERNIPEEKAVSSMVALIKTHNRWVDAPQS